MGYNSVCFLSIYLIQEHILERANNVYKKCGEKKLYKWTSDLTPEKKNRLEIVLRWHSQLGFRPKKQNKKQVTDIDQHPWGDVC